MRPGAHSLKDSGQPTDRRLGRRRAASEQHAAGFVQVKLLCLVQPRQRLNAATAGGVEILRPAFCERALAVLEPLRRGARHAQAQQSDILLELLARRL